MFSFILRTVPPKISIAFGVMDYILGAEPLVPILCSFVTSTVPVLVSGVFIVIVVRVLASPAFMGTYAMCPAVSVEASPSLHIWGPGICTLLSWVTLDRVTLFFLLLLLLE